VREEINQPHWWARRRGASTRRSGSSKQSLLLTTWRCNVGGYCRASPSSQESVVEGAHRFDIGCADPPRLTECKSQNGNMPAQPCSRCGPADAEAM